MQFKILLSIGFIELVLHCFTAAFSQGTENSAPKVTITSPAQHSAFQWNSIVPYAIRVSDKEDGNSEYNEIPANEVLLMVAYLPDSTHVKKYLSDRSKTDREVLLWMGTSTCFNCHAAKAKLIGPSFEQIAQRYTNNSTTVDSLAKKIITGSSGTWGDLKNLKMPPHPDLKIDQVREIVRWILKNSLDPDQSYFVGIEGAFRTKEKPTREPGKGIYILTASYTDHGMKGPGGPSDQVIRAGPSDRIIRAGSKQGQHTIVLKNY